MTNFNELAIAVYVSMLLLCILHNLNYKLKAKIKRRKNESKN